MHGSGWFRTKEKVTSAFFLTKTLIQRWSLVYSVNKFINPYLALKVVFKNQHCLGGRGESVSKTLKSVLMQRLNNIIELEGGGIRELMLDADKLEQVLKYWKASFRKCLNYFCRSLSVDSGKFADYNFRFVLFCTSSGNDLWLKKKWDDCSFS